MDGAEAVTVMETSLRAALRTVADLPGGEVEVKHVVAVNIPRYGEWLASGLTRDVDEALCVVSALAAEEAERDADGEAGPLGGVGAGDGDGGGAGDGEG